MPGRLSGRCMWIVAALCAGASAGCATMFTGSVDQITVASQPPGARVFVDGAYIGVTPTTLMLKTERDHAVALQLPGFQDAVSPVVREFNPVAALNLLSLVCWAIDLATGAVWRFPPHAIYVTMQPLGAPGSYPPPPLVVPPGTPPPLYPPPGAAPAGAPPPSPYSPPSAPPPSYSPPAMPPPPPVAPR